MSWRKWIPGVAGRSPGGAGGGGGKLRSDPDHDLPPGIMERVRLLEVRARELVDTVFSGEYHSIFKGRGIEFSEVREYQIGDDVRTIDWNVTARRGHPYVKRFVEERELNVLLVVDLSASTEFGTGPRPNHRVGVEIAAILALAAIGNNDRVALLLVTDRVELFVPPRSGRRHALRLLLELLTFRPRGRGTDLGLALEYAARAFRHRSIVVVVSDFIVPQAADPGFRKLVRRVARQHDLVPVRLTDPREPDLPEAGRLRILDPESGESRVVDTGSRRVRDAFRAEAREDRRRISRLFSEAGAELVDVDTSEDYVAPLVSYFRRRERSLR